MFNGPPPAEASAQELRDLIVGSYAFVDGMEQLLIELQQQRPRIWALSNYSPWVETMRAELRLDRFFEGYVVSYATGVRKPCPDAYRRLLQQSGAAAGDVLFVDDRSANVEAALRLGLQATRFTDAGALRGELASRGLVRPG
jgi:HAD superfamily hydrolase (TIGR01509 family)